jgi:phytol kinase
MVPTPGVAAAVGAVALVVGSASGRWVAALRRSGTRVAYTRKLFHIVVFTTAATVHVLADLPGTVVFGTVIAGLVVLAVLRGEGDPFYEALARESDRPHRSLFVLVPLTTTAVGGLGSALLAGPYAVVGYLAAGWGDAVGEPVGARWGRHPYRVPSLAGVPATRTLEGSAAVLVVSTLASVVGLASLGLGPSSWWVAGVCGAAAAGVEAVSNHGLDNLTVQLVPSLVAWLLLT